MIKRLLIAFLITLSLFGMAGAADRTSYPAPVVSTSQTVSVTAGENLTAGDVVSLINSGGTVTAKKNNLAANTSPNGAESVFNSTATTYCSAVALDSTRFLVAFIVASRVYSIVGTVSGSAISWGSKSAYPEDVESNNLCAAKINTDKVLICYSVADKVRMAVLSVSTATITVGTPADLSKDVAGNGSTSVSSFDTDKAVFTYRDAAITGHGHARIITVSSTTPTPYPASASDGTAFNSAITNYTSVSSLSTTSAIVAYQDGGNSNYGTAQVLSISGTTITPGTEYVFASGDSSTSYISVIANGATSAIVSYYNNSSPAAHSATRICSINGTEITYGNEADIYNNSNQSTLYISQYLINSTKFLVSYQYAGNASRTRLGTISGTSIAYDGPVALDSTGTIYISSCYLGGTKGVIVYQDGGDGNYGKAVVNQWATTDYSAIRGLCQTTTSSGASAPILLSGEATGLSGIVAGSQYWLQSDYTMGTAPVSLAIMKNSSTQTGEIFLGVGKTTSTMWFSVDYK